MLPLCPARRVSARVVSSRFDPPECAINTGKGTGDDVGVDGTGDDVAVGTIGVAVGAMGLAVDVGIRVGAGATWMTGTMVACGRARAVGVSAAGVVVVDSLVGTIVGEIDASVDDGRVEAAVAEEAEETGRDETWGVSTRAATKTHNASDATTTTREARLLRTKGGAFRRAREARAGVAFVAFVAFVAVRGVGMERGRVVTRPGACPVKRISRSATSYSMDGGSPTSPRRIPKRSI